MTRVLLLLILSSFFYSCGSSDDNEWVNRDDWGYKSNYTGNAGEAAPETIEQLQSIASSLIEAINYGNNLNNSAVRVMIPNIYRDNITSYQEVTDDGSCYPQDSNGTRTYSIWPTSEGTQTSHIVFTKYCVENPLTYNNRILINDNATVKSTITYIYSDNSSQDVNKITKKNETTFTSDNLSIMINKPLPESSDNYTFNGLVSKLSINAASSEVTSDNTTIAADMTTGETVHRFDLKTTIRPSYSKEIVFYYQSQGYVTADISLINDIVQNKDVITIKYKSKGYNNGSCTFTPKEIGTNNFDCKDK